ncbi:hypothetical protein XELAEV_18013325mg [Xenopus laevis]|uniref:Uncharacterized protein n=1 Tax=Xenopus laevis TaxID=8355 RepID=A0A974DRW5_XENLA|nr:hypothetical protein XELAEV_18013325mg [Xenopus laevis]
MIQSILCLAISMDNTFVFHAFAIVLLAAVVMAVKRWNCDRVSWPGFCPSKVVLGCLGITTWKQNTFFYVQKYSRSTLCAEVQL